MASRVALTPDGGVVLDGRLLRCLTTSCQEMPGLARFPPDGHRDASFGTGGMVYAPLPGVRVWEPGSFAGSYDIGLAIDARSRILTAGYGVPQDGAASWMTVILRFLPNGRPNTSFGDDGHVRPAGTTTDAIDPPGGILLDGDRLLVATGRTKEIDGAQYGDPVLYALDVADPSPAAPAVSAASAAAPEAPTAEAATPVPTAGTPQPTPRRATATKHETKPHKRHAKPRHRAKAKAKKARAKRAARR